ncbi:hypothetical protein Leryth_020495 [Lithospermum erythrorhizon]|nr:hypothetical protein Leryth_020495 [Lithospermum erythrorhizon]
MVLCEALVGAVISTVIENLASFLPQHFTLVDQEVGSQLKHCRTKLVMVQKVLQDAENKQDAEDLVKDGIYTTIKESRGGTIKKRKLGFSFPVITSYFAAHGGDDCSSDLASSVNNINNEIDQLIGRMHMLHLLEDVRNNSNIGRKVRNNFSS